MSGHTPGPWNYRYRFTEGDRENKQIDAYAVTADMGNVTICETLFSCADDEANARLIAVAPDLLEALEEIVDRLGTNPMRDDELAAHCWDAILEASGGKQ